MKVDYNVDRWSIRPQSYSLGVVMDRVVSLETSPRGCSQGTLSLFVAILSNCL